MKVMISRTLARFWLYFSILLIAGCSGEVFINNFIGGALSVDVHGNARSSATAIAGSSDGTYRQVSGRLNSVDDVDWFTFNVTASTTTITVYTSGGIVSTQGRLQSFNNNTDIFVVDNQANRQDNNFRVVGREVDGDQYFIEITGRKGTNLGIYQLNILLNLEDADGNGLIDVSDATELDRIRYDLDGDGQDDTNGESRTRGNSGCPLVNNMTSCRGYELVQDIDISDVSDNWIPIGNISDGYTGIFHGNSYTINKLKINDDSLPRAGLFGAIDASALISNFTLAAVDIIAGNNIGAIAGVNLGGRVEDILISGSIVGKNNVGGIVGNNSREANKIGTIKRSSSSANINAVMNGGSLGSLVGVNSGLIQNSYAQGGQVDIVAGSADVVLGGIAGYNDGDISFSYSDNTIGDGAIIGGIAGINAGKVTASYSYSKLTGGATGMVGGLVGENRPTGIIEASFAGAIVLGGTAMTILGGIAGKNQGIIETAYSAGSIGSALSTDASRVGRLVGKNAVNATIQSTYTISKVGGANVNPGGFAGTIATSSLGNVTANYWNNDVGIHNITGTGNKTVGGTPTNIKSINIRGLTNEQLTGCKVNEGRIGTTPDICTDLFPAEFWNSTSIGNLTYTWQFGNATNYPVLEFSNSVALPSFIGVNAQKCRMNVNCPPSFNQPANLVIDEGEMISFVLTGISDGGDSSQAVNITIMGTNSSGAEIFSNTSFTDAAGNPITLSAPKIVKPSMDGSPVEIKITPVADKFGEEEVIVVAKNEYGSVSRIFKVIVRPRSYVPEFSQDSYTFYVYKGTRNGTIVGQILANDEDGVQERLSYSFTESNNSGFGYFKFNVAGPVPQGENVNIITTAEFNPPQSKTSFSFVVNVSDRRAYLQDTANVTIVVTNADALSDPDNPLNDDSMDSDGDGYTNPYDTTPFDNRTYVFGNGSKDNPYLIHNIYQLQAIAGVAHDGRVLGEPDSPPALFNNPFSNFYLQAQDIDASLTKTWNRDAGFMPIGTCIDMVMSDATSCDASTLDTTTSFSGQFDGDDHTISGLYINRTADHGVGLFGHARGAADGADGVILKNIRMGQVNITGMGYVGGLVGYLAPDDAVASSTILNSHITNDTNTIVAKDAIAGGLVANNGGKGLIIGSSVHARVKASEKVGGFVGVNDGSIIASLVETRSITNVTMSTGGSFVGENSGIINHSLSHGDIASSATTTIWGGFVGNNIASGAIAASYTNTSFIRESGVSSPGGFAGAIATSSLNNIKANYWNIDVGIFNITGTGNKTVNDSSTDIDSINIRGLTNEQLTGCEMGNIMISTSVISTTCMGLFPGDVWGSQDIPIADDTITTSWEFGDENEYPYIEVQDSDGNILLPMP